jgi:hypothetical protein
MSPYLNPKRMPARAMNGVEGKKMTSMVYSRIKISGAHTPKLCSSVRKISTEKSSPKNTNPIAAAISRAIRSPKRNLCNFPEFISI